MKIDSSNSNALAALQSGSVRVSNKSGVSAAQNVGAVGATSATVNLSSVSISRAASASDINTAKVESIKAALRDGTYKVDSGKVADDMLSNARDLLKTKVS